MSGYLLDMQEIVKDFNGVKALDGISLKVRPGRSRRPVRREWRRQVRLDEKCSRRSIRTAPGKDKSTGKARRLKRPRSGKPRRPVSSSSIKELMLVPQLSVAENIFMGNEITLPGGLMN